MANLPISLEPGEVHVWYRPTDALGEIDILDALSVLSSDERRRYQRFRFVRDQRDYAAAHALLRRSLSRYAGAAPTSWTFQVAPGGKPSLVADDGMPQLSFNLSHTHGLVACAIASGSDVGVDVESVGRDVSDGVAERFFSERENADLQRCATAALRARRFIELWTLKEAYVKAIGKGLSHPLNSIVFDPSNRESIRFLPPSDVKENTWRFALCAPTDAHCLAVAVQHDPHVVPRIHVRSAEG